MEEEVFRFKKFEVQHGKSSMKVGVDAVLIGSWAGFKPTNILDLGTGCGIISLILAQRFPESKIIGIDCDEASIKEAKLNFYNSPWKEKLSAINIDFEEFIKKCREKYDLIVSNPPYFKSGIINPETSREKARHQAGLSIFSLVEETGKIIKENGVLAMIFPTEFLDQLVDKAETKGWNLKRLCFVRDNISRPEKRVMTEFVRKDNSCEINTMHLSLFKDGKPTDEYLNLCREFYLKF